MQKIIFQDISGNGIAVCSPSPKALETSSIDEIAQKTISKSFDEPVSYVIVDLDLIPQSGNWRNAWFLDGDKVDIDLEKAKVAHKDLIIAKAYGRIDKDEWGEQDFSAVKQEIEAIDIDAVTALDDLYNKWPQSIDTRSSKRKYSKYKPPE